MRAEFCTRTWVMEGNFALVSKVRAHVVLSTWTTCHERTMNLTTKPASVCASFVRRHTSTQSAEWIDGFIGGPTSIVPQKVPRANPKPVSWSDTNEQPWRPWWWDKRPTELPTWWSMAVARAMMSKRWPLLWCWLRFQKIPVVHKTVWAVDGEVRPLESPINKIWLPWDRPWWNHSQRTTTVVILVGKIHLLLLHPKTQKTTAGAFSWKSKGMFATTESYNDTLYGLLLYVPRYAISWWRPSPPILLVRFHCLHYSQRTVAPVHRYYNLYTLHIS